jgi:hypothetical protein
MKRDDRLHFRATDKETKMLRELAADLGVTMTEAIFDAVRFAYLHVDLLVAWNRMYKDEAKKTDS